MSNSVFEIIGRSQCTGCGGCYNFCLHNAIKLIINEDGFLNPEINSEKCIDCSTCLDVCPVYNIEKNNRNFIKPKTYSGWSNNPKVRFNSASGGIFYEIASHILVNSGVVYGVSWNTTFSSVKHVRITDLESLTILMGSKYIQSNVGKIYQQVVHDLKKNKQVLFSGTPCQVAVLKEYKEKYPKLILVEVLCHGVPSKLVFNKYIEYKFGNKRITNINFRYKIKSWKEFSVRVSLKNSRDYNEHHRIDEFFYGFLENYYLNEACYNCKFASLPRQADITLGDFWTKEGKFNNHELGVSLVIINNEEIDKFLNNLSNITLKKESLELAIKGNSRITTGKILKPNFRESFLENLRESGYKCVVDKYYSSSQTQRILRVFLNRYLIRFIPKMLLLKIGSLIRILDNLI